MSAYHIRDVLFSEPQIRARISRLVEELRDFCRADDFIMIGVLRGSFVFLADLVRELHRHGVHPRIDFTALESYGSGTVSSGAIRVAKEVSLDVKGADVLLVDDILDTGRTLSFAAGHLTARGARSVRTCVLLDKPARRAVPVEADHVGFRIEDVFVVGYGLDYDGRHRELPYIARVTFEA